MELGVRREILEGWEAAVDEISEPGWARMIACSSLVSTSDAARRTAERLEPTQLSPPERNYWRAMVLATI
jgi:hypothetical protein